MGVTMRMPVPVADWSRGAPAVLVLVTAFSVSAGQRPVTGAVREMACGQEHSDVSTRLFRSSPQGTAAVSDQIASAFVLFRLGRKMEAKASVDFASSLLDLTRGRLMSTAEREETRKAIADFRHCIDKSPAPPPATLTVRTYEQDDRVAGGRGGPARPGARVRIDGLLVGRTGAGGVFKGRVPSGSLHVSAGLPPSEAGLADVKLPPGGVGEVSILLESSKEVTEQTPVVVDEAEGGILPAATRTLTLKFVAPKGRVRIQQIDEVNLLAPEGNIVEELAPMFRIADGTIVAVDAAKVIGVIRDRSTGLVLLEVVGSVGELVHVSRVQFRLE
jgi:hypothetical protein